MPATSEGPLTDYEINKQLKFQMQRCIQDVLGLMLKKQMDHLGEKDTSPGLGLVIEDSDLPLPQSHELAYYQSQRSANEINFWIDLARASLSKAGTEYHPKDTCELAAWFREVIETHITKTFQPVCIEESAQLYAHLAMACFTRIALLIPHEIVKEALEYRLPVPVKGIREKISAGIAIRNGTPSFLASA